MPLTALTRLSSDNASSIGSRLENDSVVRMVHFPRKHSKERQHSSTRLSDGTFRELRLVVPNHLLDAHPDSPAWVPPKYLLGPRVVGPATLRVITGHRLIGNLNAFGCLPIFFLNLLYNLLDELSELADCKFVSVSKVDRARLVRVHKGNKTVDEVVDVLERTGLLAVAIDGHVFTFEGLDDKI